MVYRKKSKYLTIEDITSSDSKKKTRDYLVTNKKTGDVLGWINWYTPFRKYAFTSQRDIVYDPSCLNDISEYLVQLMENKNNKQ